MIITLLSTASDKPTLPDLQYMEYTNYDGQTMYFRFMDQVRPYWRKLAIGLKFLQHSIDTIRDSDDPIYYLMSEWLRGANQEQDLRPITWESLIASLRHANLQSEADILEKNLIQIETASSAVSRVGELSIITTRACIHSYQHMHYNYTLQIIT